MSSIDLHNSTKPIMDFDNKGLLLGEENALNREIVRNMRISAGFDVQCAKNGKEAVTLFTCSETDEFSAILMDIIMPVYDGLDATRIIRSSSHPRAKTIPIIALTVMGNEDDINNSLAAGMNAHLTKPIKISELFETLSKFID